MKVKELIDRLSKCDPEKPVKFTAYVPSEGNQVGPAHSDINVLVEIQDELWLVDENGKEWLDSMNWKKFYI